MFKYYDLKNSSFFTMNKKMSSRETNYSFFDVVKVILLFHNPENL